MPKLAAQKVDTVFRNAKPKGTTYLIADGNGLYLKVTTDGIKRWIFLYRFHGTKRKIALPANLYPAMGAKVAREKAQAFQEMLSRDEDPATVRKIAKASQLQATEEMREEQEKNITTFQLVAEDWIRTKFTGRSETTRKGVQQRFERNVFPRIGSRPISEIRGQELLEIVRSIEGLGKRETAHRVLGACGQVFRFAVATGRAERDIATDLRGALEPAQVSHRAAIIDPTEFGHLLQDIDAYQGWYSTRFALRLLPLVFTRPGELRLASWAEINFERAQWDIPATRMKMRLPHTVPLARQTLDILTALREQQKLFGGSPVLFPSPRQKDKPISNVAVLNALRRMGYGKEELSAHGFRATARTLLDERLRVNPILIEAQLAHQVPDALGTAYNRTLHLEDRREMMQQWADYLDALKQGKTTTAGTSRTKKRRQP